MLWEAINGPSTICIGHQYKSHSKRPYKVVLHVNCMYLLHFGTPKKKRETLKILYKGKNTYFLNYTMHDLHKFFLKNRNAQVELHTDQKNLKRNSIS